MRILDERQLCLKLDGFTIDDKLAYKGYDSDGCTGPIQTTNDTYHKEETVQDEKDWR